MPKLAMAFGEDVCDYCNIRYPDKRSLKVHEFIHVDQDMDDFLSGSGILKESDYLPKAKNLLPTGIRHNRFFEISYRKVVMNIPRWGKRYTKMFLISEAIDELLYLCKKYPLRESAGSPREKLLECDEALVAESPVVLRSPPSYSSLTPIGSSDSDSSFATSSSSEYNFDDSESELEQNESRIKCSAGKEQYDDQHINEVLSDNLMDQTSIKEPSSDSGYSSSPQQNCSELVQKDSMNPLLVSKKVDSYSAIAINELLQNLVSSAAASGDYCKSIIEKSIDSKEFKSTVKEPIPDEIAVQQSRKIDFQESGKLGLEVDKNAIAGEIHQMQNIVGNVYSMPQILC